MPSEVTFQVNTHESAIEEGREKQVLNFKQFEVLPPGVHTEDGIFLPVFVSSHVQTARPAEPALCRSSCQELELESLCLCQERLCSVTDEQSTGQKLDWVIFVVCLTIVWL